MSSMQTVEVTPSLSRQLDVRICDDTYSTGVYFTFATASLSQL